MSPMHTPAALGEFALDTHIPPEPLPGTVDILTLWWLAALGRGGPLYLRARQINIPIMAIVVDLEGK